MAVLNRFPTFSLSSQNLCPCRFSLELQQFVWESHRFPPRKLIMSASSSSTKNSRANTKVKTGKPMKSNADLCTELREFAIMVGLPEGHVPSLKELLQHGRKDLANIVRRRGYRLITDLLTKPTEGDTVIETSSAEIQMDTNSCENESVEGQDRGLSELAEDLRSSSDGSSTGNTFSSENGVLSLVSSTKNRAFIESGTSSSLLEKASKFIKDGELDKIDEYELSNGHSTFTTNGIDKEIISGSSGGQISDNASALTSKLVPRETHSDNLTSAEVFNHAVSQKEVQTSARDNEHEINRLKAMLHQKELELYQLKEQIEKEKVALSTLQAKAENEIGKAEKIMSLKDDELSTVEESLSGLKEVKIEYVGHGNTVEVTGSFNGWHHRIKMNSQPLSTSVRPTESRKSKSWSTVLWLYPGIYEIKFVVDGHWMIDPQRESVTRATIHNNILRVDR